MAAVRRKRAVQNGSKTRRPVASADRVRSSTNSTDADHEQAVKLAADDAAPDERRGRSHVARQARDHGRHPVGPPQELLAEAALEEDLFARGDALVVQDADQRDDDGQVPDRREAGEANGRQRVPQIERVPNDGVEAGRPQLRRPGVRRAALRRAGRSRADGDDADERAPRARRPAPRIARPEPTGEAGPGAWRRASPAGTGATSAAGVAPATGRASRRTAGSDRGASRRTIISRIGTGRTERPVPPSSCPLAEEC